MATPSAIRAPNITRESRSRPNESVPSGCVTDGDCHRPAMSCAPGSNRVSNGANTAMRIRTVTMPRPAAPPGVRATRRKNRSAVTGPRRGATRVRRGTNASDISGRGLLNANSWVQQPVAQVDDKVYEYEDERRDDDAPTDDRKVPGVDGVDDE